MHTWAHLEANTGNVGNNDAPVQFSARWILRNGWNDRNILYNSYIIIGWAQLEAKIGNLGDRGYLSLIFGALDFASDMGRGELLIV